MNIGLWPGRPPRHEVSASTITSWAKANAVDSVVWTALGAKFAGEDGRAPSSAADAVSYLRGLDEAARAKAKTYVVNVPAQVRTPYRAEFEEELGWRAE